MGAWMRRRAGMEARGIPWTTGGRISRHRTKHRLGKERGGPRRSRNPWGRKTFNQDSQGKMKQKDKQGSRPRSKPRPKLKAKEVEHRQGVALKWVKVHARSVVPSNLQHLTSLHHLGFQRDGSNANLSVKLYHIPGQRPIAPTMRVQFNQITKKTLSPWTYLHHNNLFESSHWVNWAFSLNLSSRQALETIYQQELN